MTMLEKYREFTKYASEHSKDCNKINSLAKKLLEEDFKEQVIDLWHFDFVTSYTKIQNREEMKRITKVEFVKEYYYSDEKKKLIEENWNKIDKIISILQDFIKELEKKEAKEVTTNE